MYAPRFAEAFSPRSPTVRVYGSRKVLFWANSAGVEACALAISTCSVFLFVLRVSCVFEFWFVLGWSTESFNSLFCLFYSWPAFEDYPTFCGMKLRARGWATFFAALHLLDGLLQECGGCLFDDWGVDPGRLQRLWETPVIPWYERARLSCERTALR